MDCTVLARNAVKSIVDFAGENFTLLHVTSAIETNVRHVLKKMEGYEFYTRKW